MDMLKRAGDTARSTASGLVGNAKDIAGQTWLGFEKTRDSAKEKMELPEWLWKIINVEEGSSGQGGSDGNGPNQTKAAAAAATGAAFGYFQSEDDPRSGQQTAKDDQMMLLTKKMIEIRNILSQVGQSGALTLPSIVVIGSQSSGKSSVLEAIVGHEFLPKGSNMVTRRPIELTLVNTPNVTTEYGEFPQLGLGKITDFTQIQRTLTDLNLAVPAKDCVSDDPIRLSIYSPNVPDLSLIDLPGYIQVVGSDQPPELKQKISDLCDKYIQPPNVILAISAADVDLANSTALRASRRVDPRGERTIGVVTKMDLVDPDRGVNILTDKKYPLRLGYVGVVSRVPQQTGLFTRNTGNISSVVARNENAYFSSHPEEFGADSGLSVGTSTLRKKLMYVLENTMAASLQTTIDSIRQELEEATYEFKVQYNDRPLSADSYLAESLDGFKHSFKAFAESFGRPQVRELLKRELDQRVLDLLAQRYWNKPITDLSATLSDPNPISTLASAGEDSAYWRRQLDASSSALTKLGIGRLATTVTANALQSHIDNLIAKSTFATHPSAREAIISAASGILNDRFYSTSDQVENCIKPFKYEIDVDDGEWSKARQSVSVSLKKELQECEAAEKAVQDSMGGKRKLKDVVSFIDRVRNGEVVLEGDGSGGAGGFSAALLQKGNYRFVLFT
jgi:dynamin-like GTPase MGM1, mitochondrial